MSVDQEALQGGVLCGYAFPRAAHVFARFADPAAGRRWLAGLAPQVTSAVPWTAGKPASTLNVALSMPGLRLLGVADDGFPEDFRDGMAARGERLGDAGPDHHAGWERGLCDRWAHAVVTVHARDDGDAALDAAVAALAVPAGVETVVEELRVLPEGREHFGFRDGLAQPAIADERAGPWQGLGTPQPGRKLESWEPVAPGEFVLGHPSEDGELPPAPPAPLDRESSYLVLRKLEQHVATWRSWMLERAGGDPAAAEALAARLMGRWPNGTPVARCPQAPDPALDDRALWAPDLDEATRRRRFALLNDFGYAGDEDGRRCPLTAHIRRSGPRDAFGDGRRSRRHRLVRRGMPYGPAAPAGRDDDGQRRGLWFACFQSSIVRQFELVQRDWLNDGDAFGLGADPDLVAGSGSPEAKAVVRDVGGRAVRVLGPLPRVVTLRGGGYFLAPSRPALAALTG
ncbi:MAG TPA: Dyp-type peroxidase [Baekduia sp.]|nr:Dyp-type peroxidase [Baekduia sp.]